MLRKRVSFKPNLKQVTSQPTTTLTTKASVASLPQDSNENDSHGLPGSEGHLGEKAKTITSNPQVYSHTSEGDNEPDSDLRIAESNNPSTDVVHQVSSCNIRQDRIHLNANQVSDERVQEAITQLTGQKFEPIKSLSLRSSANKNVKIRDLLFFNPPMTKDQKKHKKSISQAKKSEQKKLHEQEQARVVLEVDRSGQDRLCDQQNLIPKVKMGPDGKLVLDESSTIINRTNAIKDQEVIVEDNEEIISKTNYDSYRRKPSTTNQAKWSLEDTKKFYHALRILGTDFSLMESLLFSGLRSRTELHKKFKREERLNKCKIDIALSNRIALNSDELDDLKELLHK